MLLTAGSQLLIFKFVLKMNQVNTRSDQNESIYLRFRKTLKNRKRPLKTSKSAEIPDLSRKHPYYMRKFSSQGQKLEIFRHLRTFHRGLRTIFAVAYFA